METGQNHLEETNPETGHRTGEQSRMSRREALAIVGKHAVYTVPAVLAVLSVTKAKDAHAETFS